MLIPTVSRYMTTQPWTITRAAKIIDARDLMRSHDIRHLPVVDGGRLVGVVSQRDIVLSQRLGATDPSSRIDDAMINDVFVAHVDDPIDEVAEGMAERRLGSAVVVDRSEAVVGIFTTVDGMSALAEIIRRATA